MAKKIMFFTILACTFNTQAVSAGILNTFYDRSAWISAVGHSYYFTESFNVSSDLQMNNTDYTSAGTISIFYTTSGNVNESENRVIDSIDASHPYRSGDYLSLAWDVEGADSTTSLYLVGQGLMMNGFAADFSGVESDSGLSLDLDGTVVDLYTALGNQSEGFIGWTTENRVFSINFSANTSTDEIFFLDNVSTGFSPVPIPMSFWLLLTAISSLVMTRNFKTFFQK